MSLEKILWALENQAARRDPAMYHFSIFGDPSSEGTWAWRVEGHHLSLNFTIISGEFFNATPSFFGTNPAHVQSGSRKGLKVLAIEEDLARELVNSFDTNQRKTGIIDEKAPRDIITSADPKAHKLEPLGLSIKQMNADQSEMLMELLREYVYRLHGKFADREWARLTINQDIYFAWAGGLKPGEGHYYRIQGPGYLMEYDNTQNNANHVHCVWRDLKNDFGLDLLKRHYDQTPH